MLQTLKLNNIIHEQKKLPLYYKMQDVEMNQMQKSMIETTIRGHVGRVKTRHEGKVRIGQVGRIIMYM